MTIHASQFETRDIHPRLVSIKINWRIFRHGRRILDHIGGSLCLLVRWLAIGYGDRGGLGTVGVRPLEPFGDFVSLRSVEELARCREIFPVRHLRSGGETF